MVENEVVTITASSITTWRDILTICFNWLEWL